MTARAMCAHLRQLMDAHHYVPRPRAVALAAPANGAVTLQGIAFSPHVDCERVRFLPFAFAPLPADLPLYFDHDPEHGSVGVIERLDYDGEGNLQIRCTVDHREAARCNAFSVGVRIRDFAIKHAETAGFFVDVSDAVLTEVRGADQPARAGDAQIPAAAWTSAGLGERLSRSDLPWGVLF